MSANACAESAEPLANSRGGVEQSGEQRLSWLLDRIVAGRWLWARTLLVVVAGAVAWWLRFVQDDAFITYQYARNFARGEGLVFNSGDYVEGYTNFLWTVMHYIPERLGWSSPIFSQVVGIGFMMATVIVTINLATRIFDKESFGFLVGMALVANMTFLVYSTGGLETMMQAFLLTSFITLLLPPHDERAASSQHLVLAGICAGLAVLTRMDSGVLLAGWLIAVLVLQWKRSSSESNRQKSLVKTGVLVGLPAAVIVVPWLIWKLSYYGNLFPNTFYAKSAGSPLVPIAYGLLYIGVYFFSYASFLLIGRFRKYRTELFATPGVAALMSVIPIWFIYICIVGGDFMEFRFMVVVTPLFAIVFAFIMDRFTNRRMYIAVVVVMLMFSGAHRVMPTLIPVPVLTFKELNHWPSESTTSWKGKGELLAEVFLGGPKTPGQPVIAVAPLGLLTYFSDLQSVDMLGLTDPEIAREGFEIEPYYPGHVRMARVEHLLDREVNLVLAQPGAVEPDATRDAYRLSELTFLYPSADLWQLPENAQVIEIPQVDGKVWLIIYLLQNDKVDAAIAEYSWNTVPIAFECDLNDIDVVDQDAPLAGVANGLARLVAERTCPENA